MAKSFFFNEPEVVKIGNRLAKAESRKAHDSLRLLIVEEGTKKIGRLKAIKETEKAQEGKKQR